MWAVFHTKMWPFILNNKPKLDKGVWGSVGYYYGICVIQNKTNLVDAYDLNNVDPILTSTLFKNEEKYNHSFFLKVILQEILSSWIVLILSILFAWITELM